MGWLITIDSGSKACGVAYWEGLRLSYANLQTTSHGLLTRPDANIIIEVPKIYPMGKGKGDPNKLVKLAYWAGRFVGNLSHVRTIYPYEWKAQVDPDIMCERILERLDTEEISLIPDLPQSTLHNVLDAIGIGLVELGRMRVGGGPC